MTNLHLIEFKADEAINLLLAAQPHFGHSFPPGGTVSSLGILNPPLFTYLLTPLTFLTLDPRIFSFFIALANVLAIGGFFLLFKKYYGLLPTFLSGLFLAFSPWMILFSRKIWTQDLILPFSLPFFYSLHKIVVDKKMEYWIVLGISSLFLIQLHQTSIFFVILIGVFLLFKKVKIHVGYIALGILIGFLPLIPYVLYQIQNGCPDCQSLVTMRQRINPLYSPQIFLRPLQILGQGNFHHILGKDMLTLKETYPLVYQLKSLFYLEYLLLPFGIFFFIRKYTQMRFLAYSTILLTCIYFLLKVDPFTHYFLIVSPLLFLFLGITFAHFLTYKMKIIRIGSFTTIVILLSISFIFNLSFYSLLQKQRAFEGDYGISFVESKEMVSESLKKYKDDKRYEEMFLASYIPKHFMHGYSALPRMLYNFEETKKNLDELEKRLKNSPEDPLPQNELIAFYTKTTPTRETLRLLKQKAKTIPRYDAIYTESKRVYQEKNLKHLSDSGKISFEYPQHWREETTRDGIIFVKNDLYVLIISEINDSKNKYFYTSENKKYIYQNKTVNISNHAVEKTTCATSQGQWCGIMYENVLIGKTAYIFILLPLTSSRERLQDEIQVMHEIIYSATPT